MKKKDAVCIAAILHREHGEKAVAFVERQIRRYATDSVTAADWRAVLMVLQQKAQNLTPGQPAGVVERRY